ncbi:MAG: shikimate kinase [Thermodesulfobacteriota bacterium]
MNIILIGYRCSGKTSVGKRLAQKLGWPFVDTDDRLKEKHGRPVSSLVEDEGWEGFRRLERDVIREVCAEDRSVIASGGGAILDPENVAAMQNSGRVVWLRVSPQTVKQRMARDENTDELRPALTSKGLYEEIIDVLQARTPIYEQAMDVSIDTDGNNIMEIVDLVMQEIEYEKHSDDDM